MKDIKTFIIGFLSCACLFLLIGAADSDDIGRYQFQIYDYNENDKYHKKFMLDTVSGEMYKFDGYGEDIYHWDILIGEGWAFYEEDVKFPIKK